jgi:antitoxin component of MazEF toxin-antitoxin module
MARQSLEDRNIRKLGKTGNVNSPSYYVTLPVDLVRGLNWADGQKVVVKRSRQKIVIEGLELESN